MSNRLKGLDPERSSSPPTTWFKNGNRQCEARNKVNRRRCLRGAQPDSLYCATHGEYS